MTQPDAASIAAELDRLHVKATEDYRKKDIRAFMNIFAPDLRYKQLNGRIIGREQLARDVASQLASVESVESSYVRESLRVERERPIEVLMQTASVTMRHFFFFRRVWRISRRGSYTWTRLPDGWKIQEVELLDETITAGAA